MLQNANLALIFEMKTFNHQLLNFRRKVASFCGGEKKLCHAQAQTKDTEYRTQTFGDIAQVEIDDATTFHAAFMLFTSIHNCCSCIFKA